MTAAPGSARAHLLTAAVAAAAAVAVAIPATLGLSSSGGASRAHGPSVGVVGEAVWHFPWCHPDTVYCDPPFTLPPRLRKHK